MPLYFRFWLNLGSIKTIGRTYTYTANTYKGDRTIIKRVKLFGSIFESPLFRQATENTEKKSEEITKIVKKKKCNFVLFFFFTGAKT